MAGRDLDIEQAIERAVLDATLQANLDAAIDELRTGRKLTLTELTEEDAPRLLRLPLAVSRTTRRRKAP